MKILHLGSPLIILPLLIPISRIVLRLFPTILFIVNVMIWAFCGYTPNQTDPVCTYNNFDSNKRAPFYVAKVYCLVISIFTSLFKLVSIATNCYFFRFNDKK